MTGLDKLDIVLKVVEDIPLLMPEILANNWPTLPLNEFPDMCGAGEGLQEKIIPDTFYFQSQRHNCFIHDVTHTIFPPTAFGFHSSNLILLANCLNTIRTKSTSKVLKTLREKRAITYYMGVETKTGFNCYMDREDGNIGQFNYDPKLDISFIKKLAQVGVSI